MQKKTARKEFQRLENRSTFCLQNTHYLKIYTLQSNEATEEKKPLNNFKIKNKNFKIQKIV